MPFKNIKLNYMLEMKFFILKEKIITYSVSRVFFEIRI